VTTLEVHVLFGFALWVYACMYVTQISSLHYSIDTMESSILACRTASCSTQSSSTTHQDDLRGIIGSRRPQLQVAMMSMFKLSALYFDDCCNPTQALNCKLIPRLLPLNSIA
jgi:hypothetical protein